MDRFACLALTLAGLVGCTTDPETPAPRARTTTSPRDAGGAALGPDWSTIRATEERRARILASSGGALSLSDGTRVEFPPGAVAADTDVTLERLAYEGPEARSSRFYRIEPDLALTTPVTISVPFDPAAEPVGAAYFDPRAGWTEARVDVDRSTGRVAVRTDHFSVWRFTDPIWALIARQTIGDPAKSAMLSVPYYSQGGSNWCWGAATQMILKRHDVNAELWELAREIRVAKKNGVTLEQLWNGTYAQMLEARGLSVERSVMGWTFKEELTGYLIYQLMEGRPVWLALPMIGHVIVVVGFTSERIYYHDPTEENVLLRRLEEGRAQPGKTRMAAPSLTWKEWYDALSKWHRVAGVPQPVFSPGFGLMHTVVITSPGPAEPRPPVTVSVLTDEEVGFTPAGLTTPVTFLCYDGREADGLRFTQPSQQDDPVALERTYGILPSMVTNSDALSKFTVHLANGGPTEQTASVSLKLDGRPLRERTRVAVPRFTSNLEVDLLDDNDPHSLASAPLALGRHELAVSLAVDGKEVDTSVIPFVVGPGAPTGFTGVREGNRLRFRWTPNPEPEAIRYVVRKDDRPVATVDGTTWEDELRGDFKQVEFLYRLEAQAASEPTLTSMPSAWARWDAADDLPLEIVPTFVRDVADGQVAGTVRMTCTDEAARERVNAAFEEASWLLLTADVGGRKTHLWTHAVSMALNPRVATWGGAIYTPRTPGTYVVTLEAVVMGKRIRWTGELQVGPLPESVAEAREDIARRERSVAEAREALAADRTDTRRARSLLLALVDLASGLRQHLLEDDRAEQLLGEASSLLQPDDRSSAQSIKRAQAELALGRGDLEAWQRLCADADVRVDPKELADFLVAFRNDLPGAWAARAQLPEDQRRPTHFPASGEPTVR